MRYLRQEHCGRMELENQGVPSANQGMLGSKHQQKAMADEGHSSVAVHLLSMHRVVSSVFSRVWLHTHRTRQ